MTSTEQDGAVGGPDRRTALQLAATAAVSGVLATGAGVPSPASAVAEPAAPEGPPSAVQADARADELAHYYRFWEIVQGRRLVKTHGYWSFDGPEIPFDQREVHRLVENPDTQRLQEGSTAREASERCDRAYTEMLRTLNRVFDGHPQELRRAQRQMEVLGKQARALMRIPSAPGAKTVLAPAFQLAEDD
ncbi:twin-arginine translocation signal domain-containing protein [Streptomyces sp. NPDC056390]|uniref:twin-arginine translocation signal domain-containing protein n=1 Tax=Streptomyces sp. NPDC056390 TaxID=3345806 RepID=UPI0035DEF052